MRGGARYSLCLALLALLSACARQGGGQSGATLQRPALNLPAEPASAFDSLPGWRSEPVLPGVREFAAGCQNIGDRAFSPACAAARRNPPASEIAARDFLRANFRPISLGSDRLTGYFEITVSGTRTQDRDHRVPVLRTPPSPTQFSRGEILAGALAGRGLEIVWLRNEADLYWLHLQGSGRVMLPNGTSVRVGTAAVNGRPHTGYSAMFNDLPIPGHDLSGPSVRAWGEAHPAEFHRYLSREAAYNFMRETASGAGDAGPLGHFGRNLVPMLSVAVDPATTSLGSMLWINGSNPSSHRFLPHLVIAHDTGPAIVGPARLDLFYGSGEEAEQAGGHQYAAGQVWALAPK
jgi:membrane-bound lytic murein transglycosylase A